jgi:hypothetical protein
MECECKRCGYNAKTISNLKKHLNNKKPCKPIKTNISVSTLLYDISKTKIINFKCNICKREYSSRQGLYLHNKKFHTNNDNIVIKNTTTNNSNDINEIKNTTTNNDNIIIKNTTTNNSNDIISIKNDINEIKIITTNNSNDIITMKNDIIEIKNNTKKDIIAMKNDINIMKQNIQTIKDAIKSINLDIDIIFNEIAKKIYITSPK